MRFPCRVLHTLKVTRGHLDCLEFQVPQEILGLQDHRELVRKVRLAKKELKVFLVNPGALVLQVRRTRLPMNRMCKHNIPVKRTVETSRVHCCANLYTQGRKVNPPKLWQ